MPGRWFIELLRTILGRPPRLAPTAARSIPAGVTLRAYRPTDRDACVAIYTQNEPGRFPPGCLVDFEAFLDRATCLKLVLCIDDRVVAIGGVGRLPRNLAWTSVWLVFGMVHPQFHGRGLGTAMLLARLAALPEPREATKVLLTNVPTSQSFLARFGFEYHGQAMPTRSGGPVIDVRAARFDVDAWRACRESIRALGFAPEHLPDVPVAESEPSARPTG